MSKLTLASLIILASTPAFARNVDLAYGQSGTHAGGPAGLLISSTGGPVLRHAGVYRDPAYAYSGTDAGGVAAVLIRSTGGMVLRRPRPYRDPASAYSGSHAGGPAALFYSQAGRYREMPCFRPSMSKDLGGRSPTSEKAGQRLVPDRQSPLTIRVLVNSGY